MEKSDKTVIASGPVIVEDGKVLLNMHGEMPIWKFCGGKVEDFTLSLIDNAKLEVMQEMGLNIEILDREPYIFFARRDKPDGTIDLVLVHFHAKRIGEVKPGEEIIDWGWFPLDQLPDGLAPNIVPALKYFGYLP